MKVSGKPFNWKIVKTEQFTQLLDHGQDRIKDIKIDFENSMLSLLIKINERESGEVWLGPGIFLSSNPEIKMKEENIGKCFYLPPKLTSVNGNVSQGSVERIVQWLHSERLRFVESYYYNYPKRS